MNVSKRMLISIACLCGYAPCTWSGSEQRFDFETQPKEITWKAETTQPDAKAADWAIVTDATAPSPTRVLTIRRINDRAHDVFNLYWTRDMTFENGTLEVRVRANTGNIDQGGGLIWHVRDAQNYYLARYNPLERNLRVYIVTDGSRRQLASAENIPILAGRWWQLRIAHTGSRITAWLDGVKHVQVADNSLSGAGGVGFWAKADAASSFDDLVVKRFRVLPANSE